MRSLVNGLLGLGVRAETAMPLGGLLAYGGRASLLAMMPCAPVGAIVEDSIGYGPPRAAS